MVPELPNGVEFFQKTETRRTFFFARSDSTLDLQVQTQKGRAHHTTTNSTSKTSLCKKRIKCRRTWHTERNSYPAFVGTQSKWKSCSFGGIQNVKSVKFSRALWCFKIHLVKCNWNNGMETFSLQTHLCLGNFDEVCCTSLGKEIPRACDKNFNRVHSNISNWNVKPDKTDFRCSFAAFFAQFWKDQLLPGLYNLMHKIKSVQPISDTASHLISFARLLRMHRIHPNLVSGPACQE